MSNPSKQKGTKFESQVVSWLKDRLQDDSIERRALHGTRDMGDIFGLTAHGNAVGIAECKAHKSWSKADLDAWKAQTIAERGNADADFALLVVKASGVGESRFGQTPVYLQIQDLVKIANLAVLDNTFYRRCGELWVSCELETVCQFMEGGEWL